MSIATLTADIGAERAARANRRPQMSPAVIAADDATGRQYGGEGITRTAVGSARLWKVKVHFEFGGRPMLATVRAISRAQALAFTLARHPNADTARTAVLGLAA
jgi:hypothetical protein